MIQRAHCIGPLATAICAVFLAASPLTVQAQDSSLRDNPAHDRAITTLPALVVEGASASPSQSQTATKTETPLQETPTAIQVIDKREIQEQQATRLGDVLKNVSGVQSVYAFGGGYERFVIRGFEQSVANYRNGQLIPLSRFDLANVDQIEVLKGPAGALYGTGDPGGIVNIVTKLPSSTPRYDLSQSIGSHDSYRSDLGASGPLTEDGRLRYRLDAAYDTGHNFRLLSDNDRVFVAPVLEWDITPQTLLRLSYEHQRDRYAYDSGTPAEGKGLAGYPRKLSFGQPGLRDQNQSNLGEVFFEHRFSDALKLSGGVLKAGNRKTYQDVYLYDGGDRYAWFGNERVDTTSAWLDLQGKSRLGGFEHEWLVGLSSRRVKSYTDATDDYFDTIDPYNFDPRLSAVDVAPFLTAERGVVWDQRSRNVGLSLQDQITLAPQWRLLAGVRIERLTRDLSYAYYSPTEISHRRDTGTSPRLALSYLASPQWTFYGSYTQSFGPGVQYQNAELGEPEKARQFELGAKWQAADGRYTGSAALYQLNKSNISTPDPDNPNINVAIGEARSRGVELDLQGQLSAQWSLLGSYSYTDAQITKDTGGHVGNRLPYAARHQGSLWLKYAPQAVPGLSLGAGVFAAGRRYGDTANSYSDGGYAQLDLMAAYRLSLLGSKATLQLNIHNVTDALYYNLRTRWSNMPAAPRTVMVTLKAEL
ncbi:TonB-dependent siderophore receptor [Pollutimonas bauzanensis]|uniref:Iron complex outermembrane recepter protein n=1 Tax=Pollutimonas bauzanensis TaxID=658167 RepID=A0A1M5M9S0_9BURK|nr:TonB-dependent siderophore receptor [Pollutimonas bauzanensis]SHG73996.1 iron complex outermembrane recepter protein [Pollutimonas bauzanensis]